mgnify:CR=1 FL=1
MVLIKGYASKCRFCLERDLDQIVQTDPDPAADRALNRSRAAGKLGKMSLALQSLEGGPGVCRYTMQGRTYVLLVEKKVLSSLFLSFNVLLICDCNEVISYFRKNKIITILMITCIKAVIED